MIPLNRSKNSIYWPLLGAVTRPRQAIRQNDGNVRGFDKKRGLDNSRLRLRARLAYGKAR